MRILSSVVLILLLEVFDTRHHFGSRRAIALQLVGFAYMLPGILNMLTLPKLLNRYPSICTCTHLQFEMGGVLVFSSLQAALVGFGVDRLVNRKRAS